MLQVSSQRGQGKWGNTHGMELGPVRISTLGIFLATQFTPSNQKNKNQCRQEVMKKLQRFLSVPSATQQTNWVVRVGLLS